MFSEISRYKELPDIIMTDIKGRTLQSKTLRLLPEVSGAFFHTVEETDRLDHLAYKYYKQPKKWWRICDANPTFMSPQALLGKEPIVTEKFPLTFNGNDAHPRWDNVLKHLSRSIGVEDVKVLENIRLEPEKQIYEGQEVTIYAERYERSMIITYNQMNISPTDLANIIISEGFGVGHPENIGRIGKKIIIPPDVLG